MKSHCCRNRSFDTYEMKQRYIPTFVHYPIFQVSEPVDKQPRFSRTFYSTALDTEGYNIKTIHHKHLNAEPQHPAGINLNRIPPSYSHLRRIEDLYPKTGFRYQSKDKQFDHTKENFLVTVRNCHDSQILRQRKILQLSSAPVFTDFDYEPRVLNPQKKSIVEQKISLNSQKQAPLVLQHLNGKKNIQERPQIQNESSNQMNLNQILNKDFNDKKLSQQITKKDFHKNCLPQNQQSDRIIVNNKSKKSHQVPRPKTVSKNPVFTLVRGNKIDNRL